MTIDPSNKVHADTYFWLFINAYIDDGRWVFPYDMTELADLVTVHLFVDNFVNDNLRVKIEELDDFHEIVAGDTKEFFVGTLIDPEQDPYEVEVNVKAHDVVYIQRMDDGSDKLRFLVNPPKTEYERLVLVDVRLTDSYTVRETDLETGFLTEYTESKTKTYTIRF